MVLPTEEPQELDRYAQFQFKYYGKEIADFYIQLKQASGDDCDMTVSLESDDVWRLFTLDIDSDITIVQFNVFVNPQGNPAALNCYFDDFMLSSEATEWYSGLTISDTNLDLALGDEVVLSADAEGNAFSWISTDPGVVTIDQDGNVKAIGRGDAILKAIPLYGDAKECTVVVNDSGDTTGLETESIPAGVTLFPNPAINKVLFSSEGPIEKIEMYSLSGELVHVIDGNNRVRIELDVNELEQGPCLLSCQTLDGAVRYCKFIVSK